MITLVHIPLPPPPRAFIYLKEKRNLFLWYPLNDIYLNGMKRHLHSVDKWTRHFDICIITFHRIFIIIINVLLFSSVERVQMSHYHLNANLLCSLLWKSFISSFMKKFLRLGSSTNAFFSWHYEVIERKFLNILSDYALVFTPTIVIWQMRIFFSYTPLL